MKWKNHRLCCFFLPFYWDGHVMQFSNILSISSVGGSCLWAVENQILIKSNKTKHNGSSCNISAQYFICLFENCFHFALKLDCNLYGFFFFVSVRSLFFYDSFPLHLLHAAMIFRLLYKVFQLGFQHLTFKQNKKKS